MNVHNLKKITKKSKDRPSTMGFKFSKHIDVESALGSYRMSNISPTLRDTISVKNFNDKITEPL